jgi:hypothetical protein
MTKTPAHQPASTGAGADVVVLNHDGEDPATRAARTRHNNAQRAGYAAQALHHHTRASASDAEDVQQALIELLTDIHHLCNTCDLDLAPLLHTADLIYAAEVQAA